MERLPGAPFFFKVRCRKFPKHVIFGGKNVPAGQATCRTTRAFCRGSCFCREKTSLRGKPLAEQQGLGAAARREGAAARLEGAAARPEPPRRPKNAPGGLRCPPLGALGAPKGPKKPRGPHGALGAPWGPCGALGASCGPPLRCGNARSAVYSCYVEWALRGTSAGILSATPSR